MDKEVLKAYADLMTTMKSLENKKEELQTEIINMMDADGRKDYNSKFGKFEISGRRSYEYTDAVKKLQEKVYKLKKEEEHSGKAELTKYSTFIRFTGNK